ncbi:MAG: MarR family transcriptional regulator [Ponticaulis sp.]|nr:MarR family transcriptional regulator [Ponticaulis sp.]|tara:strand:- start:10967 stop:11383 length:417 start_codon:yes stop_codon:yes gene_type:complete
MVKDPLKKFPGYLLRRAANLTITELLRELSDLKLTLTEAHILMFVLANEGITQVEIGRSIGVESANMTPLVSKLMNKHLVIRKPLDGRRQALHLTDQGRPVASAVRDIIIARESELEQRIPEHLRVPFREALDHILSE